MQLEYYKKRRASLKGDYLYLHGAGVTVTLPYGKPTEVEDALAHRILSRDGDAVREVKAEKPKPRKKRTTKVVEDYNTTAAE